MEDLAIGVMTRVGGDPINAIKWIKSMGIPTMQLGCPPEEFFSGERKKELIRELEASSIKVTVIFCGYEGEDYSRVKETVGFTNPSLQEKRIRKTYEISDFAKDLGADKIGAHVGFIPENHQDPVYKSMVKAIRKVADHCKKNGQIFVFETGQEKAEVLLHFIQDVGRDNLGVNFDPANMILYGSGDPVEALEVLKDYVVSVHCKDARTPETGDLFEAQTRLGEGEVDISRFISKLKEIGYRGPLTIEREVMDRAQQTRDVLDGKKLLERLRKDP